MVALQRVNGACRGAYGLVRKRRGSSKKQREKIIISLNQKLCCKKSSVRCCCYLRLGAICLKLVLVYVYCAFCVKPPGLLAPIAAVLRKPELFVP